jgi:hypothetical protein
MQPYLFPYIGYFQLIHAVDTFVLLDDVHYINKGWINRNTLLVNGQATFFHVPLQKASQNRLINEIKVFPELKWKKTFLKTIAGAYKKSACFDAAYPVIEDIIWQQEEYISGLIQYSIHKLLGYLAIKTDVIASSAVYDNGQLQSQQRIIDICKKEKADHYINAIGGKALYAQEDFEQHQLKLFFLKPGLHPYNQLNAGFVAGLSIVDVLMHNTPQQVAQLLNQYVLEEATH